MVRSNDVWRKCLHKLSRYQADCGIDMSSLQRFPQLKSLVVFPRATGVGNVRDMEVQTDDDQMVFNAPNWEAYSDSGREDQPGDACWDFLLRMRVEALEQDVAMLRALTSADVCEVPAGLDNVPVEQEGILHTLRGTG